LFFKHLFRPFLSRIKAESNKTNTNIFILILVLYDPDINQFKIIIMIMQIHAAGQQLISFLHVQLENKPASFTAHM